MSWIDALPHRPPMRLLQEVVDVVCGESAGGNLAAVTCLRLRSNPHVAIRYQVLLQPVVDFTLSFPSIAMPAAECLVPREDLAWYYRTYRSDQCDPRDPRVSPIFPACRRRSSSPPNTTRCATKRKRMPTG